MANFQCDIRLVRGALDVGVTENTTGAGGIVQFLGDVRPFEDGERIEGIEYEAHEEMAEHQLRKIAEEAAERFGLLAIRLHHRIGFVEAGQTSLFLVVAAAHRGAAFKSAQWIVDELKKRVPIWKSIRVGSEKGREKPVVV